MDTFRQGSSAYAEIDVEQWAWIPMEPIQHAIAKAAEDPPAGLYIFAHCTYSASAPRFDGVAAQLGMALDQAAPAGVHAAACVLTFTAGARDMVALTVTRTSTL